jgi:1,4-alpha-glucan branching enzyme
MAKKKETAPAPAMRYDFSLLTDDDLYLFNEGNQFRLYLKLGSHPVRDGGEAGTYFAVWAPDAKQVSLTGDFNGWHKGSHPLRQRGTSGIWEGFLPGLGPGALYK